MTPSVHDRSILAQILREEREAREGKDTFAVEKLYRQGRGVALLGSVLLAGQLWLSWPQARVAGGIYLDSNPQGATVELLSAESLHGLHQKTIGRTSRPLPLDPKKKANFTLILSLPGYHPEIIHLSSAELTNSARTVSLRPKWPLLPALGYALRDYAPAVVLLVLGLWFALAKVRPALARQRRTAELLARQELQPGVELLGYRIEGELGRGGMSRVYRVSPTDGGKSRAMKVLRSDWTDDRTARRRFRDEVDLWRRLSHPHIVHLLDWGETAGFVWLVTELVEVASPASLKRPPFAQLEQWTQQLSEALDYAHDKGIVHRDVKPDNVLIDRSGSARLLDFGVAGRIEEGKSAGRSGTLGFMAPEQLQGAAVPASDYYSLGCTLYALACGRGPFSGDALQLLAAQGRGQYRPLSELRADCPPPFERLLSELLRPDVGRPASAQALAPLLAESKAWRSSSAEP